jgi:hypothetical protein
MFSAWLALFILILYLVAIRTQNKGHKELFLPPASSTAPPYAIKTVKPYK